MLLNEGVDDDLGVLDTPQLRQALTRTTRIQGKRGVSYTLTVRKAMPSWVRREGWIGLDPYTNKPIDYSILATPSNDAKPFALGIFNPMGTVKAQGVGKVVGIGRVDQWFFPIISNTFNLKGGIAENWHFKQSGSSIIMEKPGAHHYVLNASSFRDVVEVPFYNTTLHIPVGFEEILVGFYGRELACYGIASKVGGQTINTNA